MIPPLDDDVPTPDDTERAEANAAEDAHYKEFDQREQDILPLIAERDEALADAARWKELAEQRLARLYEVDPIYQPSAPIPRPRHAFEDRDDYATARDEGLL